MLTLNRPSLAAALRALAPIVAGARATDPRFQCVLLDATDGVTLTAISSDYALVGERTLIQAEGPHGDGEAALIPHAWFLEAAESMPGDTVRLEFGASRVTMSAGRSRMARPTLPAEDLVLPAPLADLAERCTLTGAELSHGLAQVVYAAATDTTRPALNTVLLEDTGDKLRFVAISGPQIAVHVLDEDGGHGVTEPFQLMIPRECVSPLRNFFGDSEAVAVRYGAPASTPGATAYAAFVGAHSSLRVRLPGGPYPTFAPLLDLVPKADVRLAREDFAAAVERAVIQQDTARTALRVTEGTLHMLADGLSEAVSAEVRLGEMVYSFNPRKLQAALRKVTGETVIMERRGDTMIYLRGDGPHVHGFGRLNDEKGAT